MDVSRPAPRPRIGVPPAPAGAAVDAALARLDGFVDLVPADGVRPEPDGAVDGPIDGVMDTETAASPSGFEHWVERVFARARVRGFLSGDWTPGGFVEFHSRQKMQLMAHSVEGYRAAGRIVARAGSGDRAALAAEYTAVVTAALDRPATRGTHLNTLQHIFGMVSPRLDDTTRSAVLAVLAEYHAGAVPLDVPVALLARHCAERKVRWAVAQTYLDPYPAALGPRDTVRS